MITNELYPVARYHLNSRADVIYFPDGDVEYPHFFSLITALGLVRTHNFEVLKNFSLEPIPGESYRYRVVHSDGSKEDLTNPAGYGSEKFLVYKNL